MSPKVVLVAPVLIALTAPGMAKPARPSLAKVCAVYDAHILSRLEDDGPLAAATGFALSAAIALLVAARGACKQDDHERGLNLYSWIDLDLPIPPVASIAEAR